MFNECPRGRGLYFLGSNYLTHMDTFDEGIFCNSTRHRWLTSHMMGETACCHCSDFVTSSTSPGPASGAGVA